MGMPILILLLVLVVILLVVLSRRQGGGAAVAPLDLAQLELRDLDTALESSAVYAIAFVRGNPSLDLPRITAIMAKRWSVTSKMADSSIPLQRVLETSQGRITLELIKPLARVANDATPSVSTYASLVADNPVWPQADALLADHSAAILLTASSELYGLQKAVALSQVSFALTQSCPQIVGLLWGEAQQIVSRKDVLKAFKLDFETALPLGVWVSARARRTDAGKTVGYTRGLAALGAVDFEALEAPENPQDLRNRLINLADYSIENSQQILNGDTTGVDCMERIRLQKAPSETVNKGWVFQLRYLSESDAQPWNKD